MPYLKRGHHNNVISFASEQIDDSYEWVDDNNPELVAFLDANYDQKANVETLNALEDSDKAIARVIEDLINLLIEKKSILFTELPVAVQQKLLEREKLRADHVGERDVSFLDNDDSI